jgi:hypothetical protein
MTTVRDPLRGGSNWLFDSRSAAYCTWERPLERKCADVVLLGIYQMWCRGQYLAATEQERVREDALLSLALVTECLAIGCQLQLLVYRLLTQFSEPSRRTVIIVIACGEEIRAWPSGQDCNLCYGRVSAARSQLSTRTENGEYTVWLLQCTYRALISTVAQPSQWS